MTRKIKFFLLLLSLLHWNGDRVFADTTLDLNRLVVLDYGDLIYVRNELKKPQSIYKTAYKKLIVIADSLLAVVPENVTEGDIPPTGDPHDFFTIGKFSWPNPNTPDGMPYIRGDGKHNAEAFGDRYDLSRFQRMIENVNKLTLAWFCSENEQYAAKAKELLNHWFVNSETRMNPNMNCASALPGVYNGMPVGIIFSVVLIEMLDHVKLLQESDSWDNQFDKDFKKWFSEYVLWLTTSDFGKEEQKAQNNHGSWYDAQLASYYIFIGDDRAAATLYENAKTRLAVQIAKDGSLPLETKRVEGFHYSLFAMEGFVVLARCLDIMGFDIWGYKTSDGRSLQLAFDFLTPFIMNGDQWPYKGKVTAKGLNKFRSFDWAYKKYQTPNLKAALNHLHGGFPNGNIKRLYIRFQQSEV